MSEDMLRLRGFRVDLAQKVQALKLEEDFYKPQKVRGYLFSP